MNINPHPDAIKALAACLRCVCGHKRGEDVPDARWILEALEGQFGYTLRRETMTEAELEAEFERLLNDPERWKNWPERARVFVDLAKKFRG